MMSHGIGWSRAGRVRLSSARRTVAPPLVAALLAVATAGCDMGRDPPQRTVADTTPAGVDSTRDGSAYAYHYPPAPPVLDCQGLKTFLRGFRHHVVVLEFWGSWSRQSREEISALADLHDELRDRGLRVVACSFDPPDEWVTRTVPILQGAGANYPCVVMPRETRSELRGWLGEAWNYDVPARFILDGEGRVVARAFSGSPVSRVLAKARQALDAGKLAAARSATSRLKLRARLVNTLTGGSEPLPQAVADVASPDLLAGQIVSYVAARLDRTQNRRIAVLPFPSSKRRGQAGPLGFDMARKVVSSLRDRGFHDLMGPVEAQRMIERAGISAMAIDFDPSVTRGRMDADYLIVGWIKGDGLDTTGPPSRLAADSAEDNPGAD